MENAEFGIPIEQYFGEGFYTPEELAKLVGSYAIWDSEMARNRVFGGKRVIDEPIYTDHDFWD